MGKLSPRIPREHHKYHGYTGIGVHPLSLDYFQTCMAWPQFNCAFHGFWSSQKGRPISSSEFLPMAGLPSSWPMCLEPLSRKKRNFEIKRFPSSERKMWNFPQKTSPVWNHQNDHWTLKLSWFSWSFGGWVASIPKMWNVMSLPKPLEAPVEPMGNGGTIRSSLGVWMGSSLGVWMGSSLGVWMGSSLGVWMGFLLKHFQDPPMGGVKKKQKGCKKWHPNSQTFGTPWRVERLVKDEHTLRIQICPKNPEFTL